MLLILVALAMGAPQAKAAPTPAPRAVIAEAERLAQESLAAGPQDASALQALRSEASSPAASTPEMQKQLGKKLLEEGRDARRAGAKY